MSIVPTVVKSGTGFLSSLIASRRSRLNTEATIAHQKEQSQLAYERDLEQWNRQNQYNDPSAQMARLKAAGLNPNMIYGSGSATGNVSGQSVKYHPAGGEFKQQPIQLPDVLGQYQDFEMKKANIDLINENAQLVGKKADAQDTINRILGFDETIKGSKAKYSDEYEGYSTEAKKQNVRKLKQEVINLLAKKEGIDQETAKKRIETEISGYRRDLAEHGLFPSDSLILRVIVMKNKGLSIQQIMDELKSGITGSMPIKTPW